MFGINGWIIHGDKVKYRVLGVGSESLEVKSYLSSCVVHEDLVEVYTLWELAGFNHVGLGEGHCSGIEVTGEQADNHIELLVFDWESHDDLLLEYLNFDLTLEAWCDCVRLNLLTIKCNKTITCWIPPTKEAQSSIFLSCFLACPWSPKQSAVKVMWLILYKSCCRSKV